MTEHTPVPLLSSGRHPFLNRQPWAIVEYFIPHDGGEIESSVNARYATRKEAEAALAQGPSYTVHTSTGIKVPQDERVEYDPIPWDAEPLNHPGNPILADLRRDGQLDWGMVEWWTRMIDDIIVDWRYTPGYVKHAARVIDHLKYFRDL